MSYTNEKNSQLLDYRFDETESVIREIEDFGRKFFKNETLKLGFRIFDMDKRISLKEYLLTRKNDYGEFSIYFVKDIDFNGLETKVDHEIHTEKIFMGGFCLDQLKGCCGICILFHCYINVDYRGKGFGSLFTKLQKQFAKEKYFTKLICTDRISNTPQKRILRKLGFISHFKFQNIKTKNLVELQSVDLYDEKEDNVIWKKINLIFQKYQAIKELLKKTYSTVDVIK